MDKVVAGNPGRPLQKRAQRRDGWTKTVRARFLDTLAATANVTFSAQEAGRSHNSAYGLRRRDPAFAAQWEEALAAAYVRLETELVAWALEGDAAGYAPGETDVSDAVARRGFDPKVALAVLTRHETRKAGRYHARASLARYATMAEVHQELHQVLDAVAKRKPVAE